MDELKPNMCQPVFRCGALDFDDFNKCVYFANDGDGWCKYFDGICNSAVARMNAITVLRKSMLDKKEEED